MPAANAHFKNNDHAPYLGLTALCAAAAAVGIVTGIGALVFRLMINAIHNLFFLHTLSLHYDSSTFTPENPWGAGVILVPVIGGIIASTIAALFIVPLVYGWLQEKASYKTPSLLPNEQSNEG